MSEFEDNLWLEVVREHGEKLARAVRPVRTRRRAIRPQLLAGTTVGVAAIATVSALLLSASTSAPAFAVTRNRDGTVTVNLIRPSGIAGANKKLAAMGARAQIAAPSKSAPNLVCPGGTAPIITFDPARIPERQVLVIRPGQPSAGNAAVLKAHSTGSGNTGVSAISPGGNHVVRTYSGSGQIWTSSSDDNHLVRMYCP